MLRVSLVFVLISAAIAAAAAQAQESSSSVTGNFGGADGDGYYFQAEVYRADETLALRIWETLSQGGPYDLVLENAEFEMTPLNIDGLSHIGSESLEATPDGALVLRVLADHEGYLTAREITMRHLDNMIAVTAYAEFTNRLAQRDVLPENPFSCFSDQCFSCSGDLVNGVGTVGDQPTTFAVAYDDLNASLWSAERARDLGVCPAYE